MKTKLILLALITGISTAASAQTHEVMGEVVLATFNMKDLKAALKDPRNTQTIPYKLVDNFPPYIGYNLSMAFSVGERWTLGPRFQYITTGGRLYYGDYSGYTFQDILVTGYGLSLQAKYRLTKPDKKWPVWFTLSGGAMFSKVNFVSVGALTGSPPEREEHDISKVNYVIDPAFMIKKSVFTERLSVSLSLGYEVQAYGDLTQWDGVRIAGGIAYVIQERED